MLPATSVAVADILIEPVPKLVKSASVNINGTLLAVPERVLFRVGRPVAVRLMLMVLFNSAQKFNTPVADLASLEVAPSLMPCAKATKGEEGAKVSNVKLAVALLLLLPAASLLMALILMVPLP